MERFRSNKLKDKDLTMPTTYDWSGCPLIEVDHEKMGGQPNVAGIRITPEALVDNFNSGYDPDELEDMFPGVPLPFICAVLEYAKSFHITGRTLTSK